MKMEYIQPRTTEIGIVVEQQILASSNPVIVATGGLDLSLKDFGDEAVW